MDGLCYSYFLLFEMEGQVESNNHIGEVQHEEEGKIEEVSRWGRMSRMQKGFVIGAGIGLMVMMVVGAVLLGLYVSWKPVATIQQISYISIPGQQESLKIQTIRITQKKIGSQNIDFTVQITSIVNNPLRILQQSPTGSEKTPAIVTIQLQKAGVIILATSPKDFLLYVDADQMFNYYLQNQLKSSRLLQTNINPTPALDIDDPEDILKSMQDAIVKSTAQLMGVDEKDLVLTYEQVLTGTLNAQNIYELEQEDGENVRLMQNWVRTFRQITSRVIQTDAGRAFGQILSYQPQIAQISQTTFDSQSQIQPVQQLKDTHARLLQSNKKIKLISSREASPQKVELVSETAYNSSVRCTGTKETRTCPVEGFETEEWGNKAEALTGVEKRRSRYMVRYDPEEARNRRALRMKRNKAEIPATRQEQTPSSPESLQQINIDGP